jgi:type II secretory pathway pseudopilin PulG
MLEMLVVIALIGVVATIAFPRMMYKTPEAEWPNVLEELNNLVYFARQEAISNQHNYRLNFKANGPAPDEVIVEEEVDDPEHPGRKKYQQAQSYYIKTQYIFHESIKLKSLFHGKEDVLSAADKAQGQCYVIPDGLVQDILVHAIKKEKGGESRVSFKMMPFYGRFDFSEGFVKPEK